MKVLLVVADEGRARFFETDKKFDPLDEVWDLIHPDARLKGQATHTDGHGRRQGSSQTGKTDRKATAAVAFAREVTAAAEERSREADEVILVAPPEFLGHLRKVMPDPLGRKVAKTVAKDFSRLSVHDLPDAIRPHLG